MIGVRLQGGPHDGERLALNGLPDRVEVELPVAIFVVPCRCRPGCGGTDWHRERVPGAEVYRRDEEIDGWLIYVFTDQTVGDGRPVAEREKVPAGAATS